MEDDEDVALLMESVLRGRGYEVVAFRDGAEAVLQVPGGGFQLVITDVNMPRLDGLSFLRALRASDGALPVIVLSARHQEEEILEAFDAGATDYLVKPFNPPLLLAKVSLHLPRAVRPQPALFARALPQVEDLPHDLGHLRLLALLGSGTFGSVYRAKGPEGELAVKLIHPERAKDKDVGRYFREVAALSLVDSPFVVQVHGYGELEGHHYLAMEFVPGMSAYDELKAASAGRLRPWRAARIGHDAVRGLLALREIGIAHRDVKPANILIRADRSAVLADLGLAKRSGDQSLTDCRTVIGTVEYLAPEVISGNHETARSDLYSLGVTLYRLCLGRLPYPTQPLLPLMRAILAGRAPKLVEVAPEVGPDFSGIVSRFMNSEPDHRPCLEEASALLSSYAEGAG